MEGMVEAGEYPKRKISAFMYAATVFSSLGSFLFGFHTGGISSAIPLIKYRIGIDHVWQESIVSITIGAAAVSSLVGGTISDCFGRKFTMRCSSMFFLLGSIVFIAAIGRCSSLLKNRGNFIWAPEWCPSSYAWIPVVGLLFYVLSFAPGLGIMPWIINAELYPQCLRSAGISMATTANFVFNLIVTLPFLTVVDYFGKAGTFYFLAIASLAAFLCFFLFLPETSGKHILSQFVPSWPAYENDKKHFGRRSSFSDSANFRYMRIRGHNQQFYNEDEMSE